MMENDSDIKQFIQSSIKKQDPNAKVFLFGSRARGDNRKDSDWDILILIKDSKVTNKIEDAFRNQLYDIELETGNVITSFIYPEDFWNNYLKFSPIYRAVLKEGIRLQ